MFARAAIRGRRPDAVAVGIALACALAAFAGGCAGGRADAGANPLGGGVQDDEIEILVRNDNFNQVTVYTARGRAFRRLGVVAGKGEATFSTEWYLPDIQLRVKFLAGPDFYTEVLPVSPGELLELIIPARQSQAPGE